MSIAERFGALIAPLNAPIDAADTLAVVGGAVLAGLAASLMAHALRWTVAAVQTIDAFVRDRSARRRSDVGLHVRIAAGRGRRARRAARFLEGALRADLPSFCLAAETSVRRAGGAPIRSAVALRRRLIRSGATAVLSAEVEGRGEGALTIRGLLCRAAPNGPDLKTIDATFSADPAEWTANYGRAAAYLVAKRLQPLLATPANFREARIRALGDTLYSALAAAPDLPPAVRAEVEADYCAYALQLAALTRETASLDQIISLRGETLADDAFLSAAPAAAPIARIDIGCALLAKAEIRYDPRLVQAAIDHLKSAIETLSTEPRVQRLRAASDAIVKAQELLASRKRFSIMGGL